MAELPVPSEKTLDFENGKLYAYKLPTEAAAAD